MVLQRLCPELGYRTFHPIVVYSARQISKQVHQKLLPAYRTNGPASFRAANGTFHFPEKL